MARRPEDLKKSGGINICAGFFAAYLAYTVELWVRWPLGLVAVAFVVYGLLLLRRAEVGRRNADEGAALKLHEMQEEQETPNN